jgi:hypothetical protein
MLNHANAMNHKSANPAVTASALTLGQTISGVD